MKTNIGITDENRQAVATELSKLLADEYILYTKTRNAHWNVEGVDLYGKHTFFERQFKQLDNFIDLVAERIRCLGHFAPATLQSFLSLTQFTEKSREKNDSASFIKELLADHECIIMNLREDINKFATEFHDVGSSDFITDLMEDHEKMAWYLRSNL